MKKILFLCSFLLFASSVFAQTPPAPTSYELRITGASSSTYSFAAATVNCTLTTDPGGAGTVNPRYLVWDGPTQGTVCSHDTGNNTGPLFALPIGDYSASLVAVATSGSVVALSPPSNSVSFSRLVPPAARTGFRVRGA
jgi:hypothetical protein